MPEFYLAGVIGFEPMSAGVRIPCLTAWRHPKVMFGKKNTHIKNWWTMREKRRARPVDDEAKAIFCAKGRI